MWLSRDSVAFKDIEELMAIQHPESEVEEIYEDRDHGPLTYRICCSDGRVANLEKYDA